MLDVHMPCGSPFLIRIVLTEICCNSRVVWQQSDMFCPKNEVVIQLSSKRRKKREIGKHFLGWHCLAIGRVLD